MTGFRVIGYLALNADARQRVFPHQVVECDECGALVLAEQSPLHTRWHDWDDD